MIDRDTLFKLIIHRQSYDAETNSFISSFLYKMSKEKRLDEVSIKLFKIALNNFDLKNIKLLIKAYYYPNLLKDNEYYDAIKLLSLFFSYESEYPFDNTRLNIIKRIIDEGSSFIDKELRTLFMYDLHILVKDDNDLALYLNLIDYKTLEDFLNINDISFRSLGDKDHFNKSFNYQLNFIKNSINNFNKRLIKWINIRKYIDK